MGIEKFDGLEEQLSRERDKVDVASVSFSVRELVRMYESEELSIAPSYQRKYRWPPGIASTFIESIFLGLPIPPIFVATNDDFRWEVVDGLQRISTLILFISEDEEAYKRIGQEASLVLTGLENLSQLNGETFHGLPKQIQRYFSRQPLQVISLTDKSDKQVRFSLFERLNTGAISLTPQEVRAAVYTGQFLGFVEILAANPAFASLLKLQVSNRSDGTADEQVLKYFAYKNDQRSFDGAVTKFLNQFTASAQTTFDYRMEQQVFEETFSFLSEVLDGGPFLRSRTKVTPLVQFEACGVAIGRLIQEGTDPVRPRSANWTDDPELVSSSTGGTNTRAMLARRIKRAMELFSGDI